MELWPASRKLWDPGQAGRIIADFLLPPQCLSCRERVMEPATLCARCWRELAFVTEPCCDRRGIPFAFDPGDGIVSAAALAHPPAWDRARAAVRFDERSRRLVHDLKYRDRHEVAALMARLMAVAGHSLMAESACVVPVPLYRWRLWRRRYNQSALLARRLCRSEGPWGNLPFRPDLLERTRPTAAQVGLGYRERQANVRDAFRVPDALRGDIAGRTVLLVDDVITSGATANACAAALRKAGAARVNVLAFALVHDPERFHI
ncbi:MAG TPA: double zinc ribbon domain-containing protein [Aestuariivirgaceae bacterium]|nr:double zinc ribbon domain-containing protein [Aestuariivirgaceae bacterium]